MINEAKLDDSIKKKLEEYPKALALFEKLLKDKECSPYLELANNVSISRLGFNDHGRIHVKIALDSALKILELLKTRTTLEKEKLGTREDSVVALTIGTYLHDIGMCINRKDHELFGIILAKPIMERFVRAKNKEKIISTALEAIACHMTHYKPTSIEAGILAVADGTDMTAGRARIPHLFSKRKQGSIHTYSALSIMNVKIKKGEKKPVIIEVLMKDPSGVFQIEETLLLKLKNSGLEDQFEVRAIIQKQEKPRQRRGASPALKDSNKIGTKLDGTPTQRDLPSRDGSRRQSSGPRREVIKMWG